MAPGGSSRAPSKPSQDRIALQRSYDKCAYPGCGDDLVFDALVAADQGKSVGKIAHIRAASPDGPRYDPAMSDDERASADNLVVLCGTHHDAIDSQLDYHSVEFLHEAKRVHEATGYRAVRHALGEIGFPELEVVCTSIGSMDAADAPVDLPLTVDQKLQLNSLGESTAQQIKDGLAQAGRVGSFVEFQGTHSAGFGARLAAKLKAVYHQGVADGVAGDDLFDLIVIECQTNSGPVDTPALRAAALAVVTFFFERCEIFEYESAAS